MKRKDVYCAGSIVLSFLREYNFTKAEKAFLAEWRKREWQEDHFTEESTINLVSLCASERRRKRREGDEISAEVTLNHQNDLSEPLGRSGPRKKKKGGIVKNTSDVAEGPPSDPVSSDTTGGNVTDSKLKQDPALPSCGQKTEQRRFQRVDNQQWTSTLPAELRDNSFWRKKNDSFAVKAAEQLGKVRGKDFRHEKTKKKRASWKGCGEIPMTVNSIQFNSESE